MSVTTIILSKDRPAQLDLLLRSIKQNGGGQFSPYVVWDSSSAEFFDGYQTLREEHRGAAGFHSLNPLETDVRFYLNDAEEFVCFMCDDGILYRPTPGLDGFTNYMLATTELLTISLRLGENTRVCYPTGAAQALPILERGGFEWDWTKEPQTPGESDFGYPGSIDAHVFRTADIQRMLAGKSFPNPTALECALVSGCQELAAERPLMACYPHSVYVGNPINRVSEQSGVRFGQTFPVTAAECAERFARGERIDLDSLDFSGVNGAHTEIELQWR